MNRIVHKASFPPLTLAQGVRFGLPVGHRIVHVDMQIDPNASYGAFWIQALGTGHEFRDSALQHVGTVFPQEGLVLHIYIRPIAKDKS